MKNTKIINIKLLKMERIERILENTLKECIKKILTEIKHKESKSKSESESESWLKNVLPFDVDRVNNMCCLGLTYNRGLLTQCEKKKKEGSPYCRCCTLSRIGTVEERINAGLYSYTDKKGRSPKKYRDVLKKINKSISDVILEAGRLNIKISDEHLKENECRRGRPKKECEFKKEDKKDLFACVYLDEVEDVDEVDDVCEVEIKYNLENEKKKESEKLICRKLTDAEKMRMNEIYELEREERINMRKRKKV